MDYNTYTKDAWICHDGDRYTKSSHAICVHVKQNSKNMVKKKYVLTAKLKVIDDQDYSHRFGI